MTLKAHHRRQSQIPHSTTTSTRSKFHWMNCQKMTIVEKVKPDVESKHKDQMFEGLVEPLKHGDDGLSDNRKNSNTVSDVQTSPKEPATAQPLKPWWKWWGKKTPQKTKCVSFNDDMRDESSSNPISSDGSKHNLETEPSKPWETMEEITT